MTEPAKLPWMKRPEGKTWAKEYMRSYMRQYYDKYPEKMPYRLHPKKYKEYQKAWREKNPNYFRERYQRLKATRNHTKANDKL